MLGQEFAQKCADFLVIIDDQEMRHRAHGGPSIPRAPARRNPEFCNLLLQTALGQQSVTNRRAGGHRPDKKTPDTPLVHQ